MSVVLDAVRRLVAPLTRTRLFRRVGPVLLPRIERFMTQRTPSVLT
jgi:hypothetical protein